MDLTDLIAGKTAANAGTLPRVSVTNGAILKFGASAVLSVLGMYYLATGKKEGDVEKMLLGAALSIAAFFFF